MRHVGDRDGFLETRMIRSLASPTSPPSSHPCVRTLPAGIKRAQVEDIHALHLSKNFETLKTSGLLEVGGHGTGCGTGRGKKVLLAGDLCGWEGVVSAMLVHLSRGSSRRVQCRQFLQETFSNKSRRQRSFKSSRAMRTLERLHELRLLAGLRVAVGALACLSLRQPSRTPSINPAALQFSSPDVIFYFQHSCRPNGSNPLLPRLFDKVGALTSLHAAGEAADRDSRARSDDAPGDGGNGTTGEHCGGMAGVEWYIGRNLWYA
jgi:hypothetical protein